MEQHMGFVFHLLAIMIGTRYNSRTQNLDSCQFVYFLKAILSLCYLLQSLPNTLHCVQLLDEWRSTISTDAITVDYISCAKSRHDQQWYQKPVAIAEFILHQNFMLLVVVATVYHVKKGKQTRCVNTIVQKFALSSNSSPNYFY